ncbi:hypothetical protein DVH24_040600 [Malus domestica]|uniref:AAA ATPase AAA+ lid domain-containing protein n=1 Tax=Malus domestica TaxID=3750 RepID=A0A498IE45_MALDO|nr:hypothetical protein DVH24_040600 [Malus domestica]
MLELQREQDERIASQLFTLLDSNQDVLSILTTPAEEERFQILKVRAMLSKFCKRYYGLTFSCSLNSKYNSVNECSALHKKVPLDTNVDLHGIAASCNGFVGADLKHYVVRLLCLQ